MIISAVNAMTMTPARAASIFGSRKAGEQGDEGKEALPWWFFGLLGGLASVWLLAPTLGPRLGLTAVAEGEAAVGGLKGTLQSWGVYVVLFVPGAVPGGVLGWFIMRPVNRAVGSLQRGRHAFLRCVCPCEAHVPGMCERQERQCRRKVGVECDRTLEKPPSLGVFGSEALASELQAHLVEAPCFEVFGAPPSCALRFHTTHVAGDRRCDRAADLILEREHVLYLAIIGLGPDVLTGGRVDELGRDANAIARSAHAALDQIARTELETHLPRCHRFCPATHGGSKRSIYALA
jgi:hypothetical protein